MNKERWERTGPVHFANREDAVRFWHSAKAKGLNVSGNYREDIGYVIMNEDHDHWADQSALAKAISGNFGDNHAAYIADRYYAA